MFTYNSTYLSERLPVFARNAVATSHPLAAQAGLRVLQQGGNAVDAAVAAGAAMTICEPVSNGLGSDAFCILWDGQQLHGLNASGRAPAAWTSGYFEGKYPGSVNPPKRGMDAVTVPGAVGAWVQLNQRFGRLPLGDVLAPAIEIAERGYLLPVVVQQEVGGGGAGTAGPAGLRAGVHAARPRAGGRAVPLRRRPGAADRGAKGAAFYGGEIAQAIEKFSAEHGGAHKASDFEAYQPEWVTPIGTDYRGHTLHEIPPNGQGIAALIALGILREFDLSGMGADSLDATHLQIEAMKLAFADVYQYVAEPSRMAVTPAQMLDETYLRERARLIRMDRAQDFGAGNPVKGGTIYLTAADEDGMMVSFIKATTWASAPVAWSRVRHQPAEPRPRRWPRSVSPNAVARAAGLPHHHPGLPHLRTASRS